MSKIIPKKVEMLELFYDLIFVYAVAKMTAMIHHPHHGHVNLINILQYIAVCFIVLHIWLYQTNYINRYGNHSVLENILLTINMAATVYMANSINTTWEDTYSSFNIAMIIMVLTVIGQFSLHFSNSNKPNREVIGFITTLSIETILVLIGLALGYEKGLYIVLLGYACGMLLPFLFTTKHLKEDRTNFPHLVERMGLITIITFGETIVGITALFDTKELSILPILVFTSVVLLFSIYVIQMDKLVNHHQYNKGLIVMYTHFGLIVSLGIMTVSWTFLINNEVDRTFLVEFMASGLLLFYITLFINSVYNKVNKKLTLKDIIFFLGIFALTVVALFIGKDNNIAFATTMLISSLVIAIRMYMKMKFD